MFNVIYLDMKLIMKKKVIKKAIKKEKDDIEDIDIDMEDMDLESEKKTIVKEDEKKKPNTNRVNKKYNRKKKQVDMSKNHIEDNIEYFEYLEEQVINGIVCYVPIIKNKLVKGYVYNEKSERIGTTVGNKILFYD
jgi:hypothetical protein